MASASAGSGASVGSVGAGGERHEPVGEATSQADGAIAKAPASGPSRPFATTLAFGSQIELDEPKTQRSLEASPEVAPPTNDAGAEPAAAEPPSSAGAALEPDAISVPPIVETSMDDPFFSEGDAQKHHEPHPLEDALTIADPAKLRHQPEVIERRARFVRYVKWAVSGAAIVCLAAAARSSFPTREAPAPVRVASVAAEPAPVTPKAAAASVDTPPSASPPSTSAAPPAEAPEKAAEPSPAAGSASPAAPAAAPSASAASAAAPADEPAADAKQEKEKARRFLETRKLAEAIAAGERSVALDPTDGEAWLILGASYQEKGNLTEARRAYTACVKEGKRGPRSECMNLLR